MNKEQKYVIYFKDKKIPSIEFPIQKDKFGRFRIPKPVTTKNENYIHNGSENSLEEMINWVKQKLWKYEIKEIKNITSESTG